MIQDVKIHGYCDRRFKSVKRVFETNFEQGLECGASFAATINGKFVVDLWGGFMDETKTRPWEENTISPVASTTKIMAALCIHMLVDRGKLDINNPVAKYWPEFAQAGKENLPVRYILSHTAGLAGFDEPVKVEDLLDWDLITTLLAKQKPWWEPGTESGYHGITFNFLLGEIIRRISGKPLKTFFRDEVAIPLNADFHIGLTKQQLSRYSEFIPSDLPESALLKNLSQDLMLVRVFSNPHLILPLNPKGLEKRNRLKNKIEGFGNARSVALIAALMACGGELNNIRLLSLNTIEKAIEEQIYSTDLVLGVPIRFGLGFGLRSKEKPYPNQRTFYWSGVGGSFVIMDLDAKVSIAYVPNQMRYQTPEETQSNKYANDTRANRLITAFFEAL